MRVIADDEIVAAVRAVLPDAEAVYLFGSHATPYQTEESDLDLAIVHPGRLSGLQMWQAGAALSETLAITVDLLDLRAVDTIIQNQVITTGRRIFGEGLTLDLYETYVLSAMTALDELRAPMVADILKRGSVHGL